MRVVEIREPFGVDALVFAEREDPTPGPGQVLVQMRACALNYRDLLIVNGTWRPPTPRIPGSDGVGRVVATGPGVSRVAVGDRVAAIFYPKWLEGDVAPEKLASPPGGVAADGLLAEYTRLDGTALVQVPHHLSDEEAATLPTASVTAWHGVVVEGRLEPGGSVVVLGTGGVSLFALQFAHRLGARVIVTSSSDRKLERATELGAAAVVNYRTSADWPAAVAELTGGRGADLVVDTVGALDASITAVRVGGVVSFIGFLGGSSAQLDLVALMRKSARVQAIDVGSRRMFEAMNEAIRVHRLRPVLDQVFDFSEAPAAFRRLAQARPFGKVTVRF